MRRVISIAIFFCCLLFGSNVFSQANHLRLTKEEINSKYSNELTLSDNSLIYENILFKYVFHFDNNGKCNKVMFLPLSPQYNEIFLEITNDRYDLVKQNNWISIERDFTISVTYIKNAGDLGSNGAYIYQEN